MKKTRHVRKARRLFDQCEDFFLKELGKNAWNNCHPFYLENLEDNTAILYANTFKDRKRLEDIYFTWRVKFG